MKTFNKTLIAAATITTLGLAAAPTALALDASASLATSYLWRGTELGNGDAALAVDLSGSTGAISYGLWVSSGDSTSTEYDIYASYGGSVGEVGYSIGYASYNYPSTGVGFDDAAEYIYGLSYGPASVTIFDGKDSDYEYTVVGYEAGAFSFAYGDDETSTHFDVSYAVNDSLTLTVSDPEDADTIVVASYALPF
ncbi:histidine kinase [Porticoccaceae bacterium]|nr:histidine kinase [Porticoccaceae bacterium]